MGQLAYRLGLGTGLVGLLLGSVVACVGSTDDRGAASSEIIGGSFSSHAAIVVAVDAHDRFACTGAIVAPDVVAVPDYCDAAAVYVGAVSKFGETDTIGPLAPSAARIAIDASAPRPRVATCLYKSPIETMRLLRLATPAAVTPLVSVDTTPSVGTSCEVVGHGSRSAFEPDAGFGEQRSAVQPVTRLESCLIATETGTGEVAFGDWNGFLLCGGKLAGVKNVTNYLRADGGETKETTFASLADPGVAAGFAAAMGEVIGGTTDAGAPVPFASCSTPDAVGLVACGRCGVQKSVCLATDGGGAEWSAFSACFGEDPTGCVPGTVGASTTAGCATGSRTSTCGTDCRWRFAVACH